MKEENIAGEIWETDGISIDNQSRPEHPYFAKAYDFIQSWRSDTMSFNLQTSGSTGIPKIISVSRNQLSSSAAMTGRALDLGSGTRALVCLNIEYVAGIMMLVRGMELGWELTIMEPVANPLNHLPREVQFDFVALVPMQMAACLEDKRTKDNIKHLGKVLLGGAPVSRTLLKQIQNLDIPVYQSYGMTETVSHVALRKLNGKNRGEAYQFLPGVSAGMDARGCLFVSGQMTNGETIQTNDLVEMKTNNEFIWLGRYDNVINSGGVKIILDRVDEQIAVVLEVLQFLNPYFSWFQEDEKLGQKLVLFIEGEGNDVEEERLIQEIRKQVSAYQTPKHVYFVNRFEKTPTDKTDKRRTAAMLFTNING